MHSVTDMTATRASSLPSTAPRAGHFMLERCLSPSSLRTSAYLCDSALSLSFLCFLSVPISANSVIIPMILLLFRYSTVTDFARFRG